MSAENVRCRSLLVKGTVQGVGFRPFIYSLAQKYDLKGTVANTGQGVEIHIEGSPAAVRSFIMHLRESPPPLASIHHLDVRSLPPAGYSKFTISSSAGEPDGHFTVPPDVALCPDCCRELEDPGDRRYKYAFTNCTNCGPRFSIVKGLPYDRRRTTMFSFRMCAKCASEYNSTGDRRFHAQPIACPDCGPKVFLLDRDGREQRGDWVQTAHLLLESGKILAVKGLGGFHLACDAGSQNAVADLRRRKNRPAKPFAVMCRDIKTIERLCAVGSAEKKILLSPAAPIVLLKRRKGCTLPEELAPGITSLGMMLPYTPIHRLLLSGRLGALVMTSGNISGLPIEKDNEGALQGLCGVADYFLLHDREIANRCDDSVVGVEGGKKYFIRRSRGYVPDPVKVPVPGVSPVVLAVGGETKNTFCLIKDGIAYPGPYMGDLDTLEGRENYMEALKKFLRMAGARPDAVAFDLHPQYHSSRMGDLFQDGLKIKVQHHHAHMAACMAENGINEAVTGVILDGTGYGEDGASWGFEILEGDYRHYKRVFHLSYVPLPGGDGAVRRPWVTASSYLITMLGNRGKKAARDLFGRHGEKFLWVEKMLEKGLNCHPSGGCGRLFDAVAAITGVCGGSSYEGEAAVRLEEAAWEAASSVDVRAGDALYPFVIEGDVINPAGALEKILAHLEAGVPVRDIALGFHSSLASIIIESVQRISDRGGSKKVALSGGCWQNRLLLSLAVKGLEKKGFKVYTHSLVPANDGGISLGQSVVSVYRLLDHSRTY